jgi:hypothetical protein
MGFNFTQGLANRLIVGDTTATYLEVGIAPAYGSAGQDVAALRYRTGASTPIGDLLALYYDDMLASVQLVGGSLAHAIQVRADGNASLYSRAPAASGQDFPGVSLYAENGVSVVPAKHAYLHLYSGAGVGSHARIIGEVNDADGKGNVAGNVPLIPGSTRQIYAQAGQITSNYVAGGWTLAWPAFPNATIAVVAMWVNSGAACTCSAYSVTASGCRVQVWVAGAELGAGAVGAGAMWMAWGY